MQSEHCVAGKALEQSAIHHAATAAKLFFYWLKDQMQRAVQCLRLGHAARSGEQDGGVAVVAAGVHLVEVLAGSASTVHLVAPLGRPSRHQITGGVFIERQFGVRMDVTAHVQHLGGRDVLGVGPNLGAEAVPAQTGQTCHPWFLLSGWSHHAAVRLIEKRSATWST